MPILHSLLAELKAEFSDSEKGKERSVWFLHTLLAIILPFTSSKTSNLLRVFHVIFGFAQIGKKRYYTFIASPKIPWDRLWSRVWKMIPQPQTNGRLLVALDDYLNPKTGKKIFGTTTSLAKANRDRVEELVVNLYGRKRTALFSQCIVMKKTLKCPIRVVWVYRRTQWVALFTTDLSLSVAEIIEYYGARWMEAGFKELKQDISSAETQNRHPVAVQNHLNFCMMATSITWVYACHLNKTPSRRHAVKGRSHFAFSDVRRLIAQEALDEDFQLVCPLPRKPTENTFAAAFMRLAA